MPEPIIALQRRLTLVGAIRAGGEKQPNKPGRKLDAFRLTSPRRELIEQAASIYGGEVSAWQSPVGDEWQVYTTAEELPVLVMPSYSLRQSYELWEGTTKRLRVCDGIDEELSGGPCMCNQSGEDACDLYTRLVVALPDLDTVLGWRLITRGANAGHELPTMMAMIEAAAKGTTFVPARLRIDERRGVKDGQVVRFIVPTIDLGASYKTLAAGTATPPPAELPAVGYTPAPERTPTVREALGAVAPAGPTATGDRSTAALSDYDPPAEQPVTVPAEDEPGSYSQRRQTLYATDPQKAKLNVLIGQLREAGHVTTEGIYLAVASRLRNIEAGDLVREVGGRDEDGVLHWAPLREALLRPEANQLIDWMEEKARRVGVAQGQSAAQGGSEAALDEHGFPRGY